MAMRALGSRLLGSLAGAASSSSGCSSASAAAAAAAGGAAAAAAATRAASTSAAAAGGAAAPSTSSAGTSTPTVFDRMVQVFVIDRSGVRHTVRGVEGASLAETLLEYGRLGGDAFMPHVYDPGHPDCHVYVQGDYLEKLPALDDGKVQEQAAVLDMCVRGAARDNSRMAHFIKLAPALNGMTVALGPVEPWETQ